MQNKQTDTQWVSFSLGNEIFACNIKKIQEVIPYQKPTPVPGSPIEVEGVLNVRGDIVPVISGEQISGNQNPEAKASPEKAAKLKCDSEDTIKKEKKNIVILGSEHNLIGMTIDSVKEIIQISPDKIEHETKDNTCIKGSALHEDKLIILLDIATENFQNKIDT